MSSSWSFDVVQQGDIIEIRLPATRLFDSDDYAALHCELMEFVKQTSPQKLLVHFGRIEYCSTAIMNGLLEVRNRLEEEGRRMKLCGMSAEVHEAFRMLQLDGTVFDIYSRKEDALGAF